MKEPSGLIGKSDLNKRNMSKVVMHTADPYSTIEATEILVKTVEITYAKADLKQVAASATQMNNEETTQLLRLLEDFKDLFDGTLGAWDTEPVNLELNPGSKSFNSKYYTVLRINKETYCKDLKCSVEIGVLTPVQQSQFGTPVFIIPNK